ncbi:MAG: acetyl-CoA carboxylase biotin carboxyl carrier protein, partial [Sutterella wadsworthensis]|nr:acetyl-CoA carboxylase biotin carboxyl carrier protein [Sutterella wadsworthensis]
EDRVRIVNRNGAAPVQVHQPVTVAQPMPVPVPAPEVAPAPAPTAPQQTGTPLTSPMVGTFYRAPSPGADPFVKVGDTVKKGQVVCIIEAMKLLNEVEADMDGTVKEVCVENGQPVEFGQSLFIIE